MNSSDYSLNLSQDPKSELLSKVDIGVLVVSTVIIGLFGLLLYGWYCVTIVYFRRRNEFQGTFYLFTLHLALPDIIALVIALIFTPTTCLWGSRIFEESWVQDVSGALLTICFYVVLTQIICIGVHRYLAFNCYENYEKIFTKLRIAMCIAAGWLLGVTGCLIIYMCGCKLTYQRFFWQYNCQQQDIWDDVALCIHGIATTTMAVAVAVIYVLSFVEFKKLQRFSVLNRRQRVTSQHEKSLLLQFLAISTSLLLFVCLFWLVHMFGQDNVSTALMLHFIVLINICLNPIFYIVFSSEVRSKLPWCLRGEAAAVTENVSARLARSTAEDSHMCDTVI